MAVSKVVYGNNTLIDLTSDTVAAENLLEGYTAHGADGEPIVGTASGGASLGDMEFSPFKSFFTVGAYGGSYEQFFELSDVLCNLASKLHLKGCLYRSGGGTTSKSQTFTVYVICNDGVNTYSVVPSGDSYSLVKTTETTLPSSAKYVEYTNSGTSATFSRKAVDVELDMASIRNFVVNSGCSFGRVSPCVNQGFQNDGVVVKVFGTRTASSVVNAAYFGFSVVQNKSSAVADKVNEILANDPQVKVTF